MIKKIKGQSLLLAIVLLWAILALSFFPGNGRKLLESSEERAAARALTISEGEKAREERRVVEVMDYDEPGPNVNPGSSLPIPTPPPGGR
ncbi:hypothetical protein Dimus_003525 [Dionaea muscipula]